MPNHAILDRVELKRRDVERTALAAPADYARDAAYRRLALTILGLDVQSLVHALPVRGKETT